MSITELPALWRDRADNLERGGDAQLAAAYRNCAGELDASLASTGPGGYREGKTGAAYDQDYDPETGR